MEVTSLHRLSEQIRRTSQKVKKGIASTRSGKAGCKGCMYSVYIHSTVYIQTLAENVDIKTDFNTKKLLIDYLIFSVVKEIEDDSFDRMAGHTDSIELGPQEGTIIKLYDFQEEQCYEVCC